MNENVWSREWLTKPWQDSRGNSWADPSDWRWSPRSFGCKLGIRAENRTNKNARKDKKKTNISSHLHSPAVNSVNVVEIQVIVDVIRDAENWFCEEWKFSNSDLVASLSASIEQEAAMTAFVEATAGMIRFRTPCVRRRSTPRISVILMDSYTSTHPRIIDCRK